jgi:hypothetical protein
MTKNLKTNKNKQKSNNNFAIIKQKVLELELSICCGLMLKTGQKDQIQKHLLQIKANLAFC